MRALFRLTVMSDDTVKTLVVLVIGAISIVVWRVRKHRADRREREGLLEEGRTCPTVPGFSRCTREPFHDGPCALHIDGCPAAWKWVLMGIERSPHRCTCGGAGQVETT